MIFNCNYDICLRSSQITARQETNIYIFFFLPKRINLFLELRMPTSGATCYPKQAFVVKRPRHTYVAVDNIGSNIASNK